MDHEKKLCWKDDVIRESQNKHAEPSPTTFNMILRVYGCLTTTETIHDIVVLFWLLNKLCQYCHVSQTLGPSL